MIYKEIDRLVSYGILTGLIAEGDKTYVTNRLLAKLGLDGYVKMSQSLTGYFRASATMPRRTA